MSNEPYLYPTNALNDVMTERRRQEKLRLNGVHPWTCATVGVPDPLRLLILAEEFGEIAHLVGDDLPPSKLSREEYVKKLREELVQVAAVATAWVEAIDSEQEGNTKNAT